MRRLKNLKIGNKSPFIKEQRKNLYVFLKKYGVRGEAPSSNLPPLKGSRGVDKKVKTFSNLLIIALSIIFISVAGYMGYHFANENVKHPGNIQFVALITGSSVMIAVDLCIIAGLIIALMRYRPITKIIENLNENEADKFV